MLVVVETKKSTKSTSENRILWVFLAGVGYLGPLALESVDDSQKKLKVFGNNNFQGK